MDDDEPPSTSTSSESPEEVKPAKTSSRKRRASRRDRQMEEDEGHDKESQSQYAKGFFDALRVVQNSHKFEFNDSSPVIPTLSQKSFSPITPATASDMRTIVMSFLGNTPISTSGGPGIPALSSPILPLVDTLQIDEISMKLLASSALPGPPLQLSSSNSPDSSSSATQIVLPPLLSNLVSSTSASTSRPDKLTFSPPRAQLDLSSHNPNSDESDGGFAESRSVSRGGRGVDEIGMGDQEKKKLERKRARNRQAASKCRQKKMDRIKELEEQVTNEKHRGQRLDVELTELQRALDNFRRVVDRHAHGGCATQSIRV